MKPIVAAYIASRSRERNDRQNEYNGIQRQPNQYGERNDMVRGWNEEGRTYEGGEPESRYRGQDGRWKAGTRRSEYDGGAYDTYPSGRRMDDDYDGGNDMPSNVIQWPYSPVMPHRPNESRLIGFGNRPREYETRSHYDDGRQEAEVGGTMWMQPVQNHQAKETMHFDRQIAEEWVEHMENSDPSHPRGGKWTPDDLKPQARKLGLPEEGEKYWEFYAMMNAMYSDYAPVAKKFGITSPEFYACMAKAWMEDKDARDDKTALYYKYIVER